MQPQHIVARAYESDGEQDVLVGLELSDDTPEVDVSFGPRTVSLTAEEAWKFARELARSAAALESRSGRNSQLPCYCSGSGQPSAICPCHGAGAALRVERGDG